MRGLFELTRAMVARIIVVVKKNIVLVRYPFERVAKSFRSGELRNEAVGSATGARTNHNAKPSAAEALLIWRQLRHG
jgi:hypothetical protein